MELETKVALITGGATRVGRGIAIALATQGMRVIIHYNKSKSAALETSDEIALQGEECRLVQADLRSKMQVDELLQTALQHWGRVDLLVNNASLHTRTPFSELSPTEWDQVMDVNLRGTFLCSLAFGRQMKTQGGGKIINIADWAAEHPSADYLPYCVSKAGVIALTKALARALAPTVQVNCISPGAILMPEHFSEKESDHPADPALEKRICSPDDIVAALLFLASGSDNITGTNIVI